MPIFVRLDDVLHARRMTLTQLADRIGLTLANLSILKTGKARAVRFSTLEAICEALQCQPGDLLEYASSAIADEASAPTRHLRPLEHAGARFEDPSRGGMTHMADVSLFRLYALRAGYLLIAVGLASTIWPLLLNHSPTWPLMNGVVCSLLAGVSGSGRCRNSLSVADAAGSALRDCLEEHPDERRARRDSRACWREDCVAASLDPCARRQPGTLEALRSNVLARGRKP